MFSAGRERARLRPFLQMLVDLYLQAVAEGQMTQEQKNRAHGTLQALREDVHERAVRQSVAEAQLRGDYYPWFPKTATPVRPDLSDRLLEAAKRVQPQFRRDVIGSRLEAVALAPGRELARRVIEEAPDEYVREPNEREKAFDEMTTRRKRNRVNDKSLDEQSFFEELLALKQSTPEPEDDSLWDPDKDPERQPSKRKKPVGWARVLRGETNCALCVMLASRGPVYRSNTVGTQTKNGVRDDAVRLYHPNCDCDAVLVYDVMDWPGINSYMASKEIYDRATRSVDDRASSPAWRDNPFLQALDKYMREHKDQVERTFNRYG